jgi:outer membrane protein, heavy metal efflux system
MRNRAFFFALISVFFQLDSAVFPTPAQAQLAPSAPNLTLSAATELALAHNPEIAVAKREFEASEGASIQGRVRSNPALSFMQEDTRRATRSSTLQLSVPIELQGKRQARVDAADQGRALAGLELVQRQVEISAAVMAAFFEVLSSQERIQLAQETLVLTQRVTDITAKRVMAGKISPVEETKARVAQAQVKVELGQAQGQLRIARQRLCALMGQISPSFDRVEGVIKRPEVPDSKTLEQRIAQSPTLRRAEMELERRAVLTRVEQSKRLPDPTVSLGVKRGAPESANQLLLGVSVPLPLFDRNQGNVLEALQREDKARDEITAQRVRLHSEVMQALEQLVTAQAEAQALRIEVLPGAQSALDAASKGFEAGKFGFLEVLDAQRTLIAAKAQVWRASVAAHRAAFDIERLLGDAPIKTDKRN